MKVEWVFVHDFYDVNPMTDDENCPITVPVVRVEALKEWIAWKRQWNDNETSHYQTGQRDACRDLLDALKEQP